MGAVKNTGKIRFSDTEIVAEVESWRNDVTAANELVGALRRFAGYCSSRDRQFYLSCAEHLAEQYLLDDLPG